ncbi:MAG: NAD-dependent deacylase [Firmicutes bacterium]|nr:NAD-dependent deacylase [Bacillota bacterium]
MDYQEKIKTFADMVKDSKKTVALTGAGISTESGIPDYRSPGTGLWEQFDPIEAASLSALRKDPAKFYTINLDRWTAYGDVQPNATHLALARLEKLGYLLGTITQNIDSLLRKAGAERVWEVHGHLRTCRCIECGSGYDFSILREQVVSGNNPPVCEKCKGVLRPDVVLFGDHMSEDFFQACQILSGCQLLIVAGSSLTVHPVASLPEFARHVVIINKTETPWDDKADIVINDSSGKVFSDLMDQLGEK